MTAARLASVPVGLGRPTARLGRLDVPGEVPEDPGRLAGGGVDLDLAGPLGPEILADPAEFERQRVQRGGRMKYVTKSVPHESARGHVTGAALYTGDLAARFPNLLYAMPAMAPHAHANVLAIDASAAAALRSCRVSVL